MAPRGETRLRVLAALRDDPQATIRELSMRLELGATTVFYHVNTLEASGVVSRIDVRRVRYVNNFPRNLGQRVSQEKVYEAFIANPGATYSELSEMSGVCNVRHHLRELAKEGKIDLSKRKADYSKAKEARRMKRRLKGHVSLPRLSEKRQEELIEQVVAKAREREDAMRNAEDVIRINHAVWGMKAHRIG